AMGERFGTIGGVFGETRVEITTYRSEQYTAGSRKPAVTFGTSLQGDLSRRDFTINAMARPASGGDLVDPFGGQRDLANRVIRAVGNPDERFSEDPLRLLRGVRFAAQRAFDIDPDTWAAMVRNADALRTISAERIAQEMNRIMLMAFPSRPLRQLCDLGLMKFIVPELLDLREPPTRQARHKDTFEHTLQVVDRAPSVLTVRWAALLHDIAKPRVMSINDEEVHFHGHEMVGERMTRRILNRLKMDRATVDRVATTVVLSGRINSYEGEWTDGAVRRLVRDAGDALGDLIMLSRSDVTSRREDRIRAAQRRVDDLIARVERLQTEEDVAKIKPPLDGLELMELFGRGPGPWIRPIKDRLLSMVLDGELAPDDRERATAIARAIVEAESAYPGATI
ncbi:MAG: polynucleotide adenylyltransferase/metal dependent phosphohydrolase, partial [Chloroflexi bacterium]|nr:polynucleotide adenylyltransferase/metal dependent phosphohydrolase [Chloroflexota bacterium]